MSEREDFVLEHLRGESGMAELCRKYGVSRKTGYKWVQRFLDGGIPGLMNSSRAPLTSPQATSEEVVDAIVKLKKRYPTWGAKKLRSRLARDEPTVQWPSEATIGRILKRRGLVQEKRRMRRTPLAEHPLATPRQPNETWCVDFKGKFRVRNTYCYPLTISDADSRYVLCCQDVQGERLEPTKEAFTQTFKEYGLPLRIRSDNGTPFASTAIGGLSRLSVWWVKLGILPERTRPGHPQDNGRHERMHRTLKAEVARPPQPSLAEQQKAFDNWRKEYNEQRPHEALKMKVPADVYRKSGRAMPDAIGDPEYPDYFDVRKVRPNGTIKLDGGSTHLGSVLTGETVGLESITDAVWQLWFGPIYLGLLTQLGKGETRLDKNQPYRKPQPPNL